MSADIENKKDDEDEKNEPKRRLFTTILQQWHIAIKIVELVFSAACIGFVYEPIATTGLSNLHLHHIGVMYTTYTGSILIIMCLLFGFVLKDRIGYKTSFIFSTACGALFLTTGVLLTADKADLTKDHFFHPTRYLLNMMTTAIILTFINSIIFIVDAVLSFKYQREI